MKGRALRCIADNAFDASGWWPVVHRCQASGIRAFAARCAELLLQLALPQCPYFTGHSVAQCAGAPCKGKAHQVRHASTTAGRVPTVHSEVGSLQRFLQHHSAREDSLYLLEQAFSAPRLPPGHRFPMVGAAAAPTPCYELDDCAPGLSHASLRRRRVCVLRAGVGRVPANLCYADPRWDAP